MGEVFLDAFIDTLKVLPFLLIMNFVIEFLEYRSGGLRADGIMKGGLAPLIGTAVGVVPQCGFSVVATELYGKRKIALGTILAVYIATSDEALPIMLSSYAGVTKILPVLIIKICFALIVGYSVFAIEKIASRRSHTQAEAAATEHDHEHVHDHEHSDGKEDEHGRAVHIHGCHKHDLCGEEYAEGAENLTKKQKAAYVWKRYLMHPIVHTSTVILYIFIVNIIFGITVYYVGEARFVEFIGSTGYLQPVLTSIVGLIPNCASSVVITELYVVGGLSLGGAVAGLCMGAGIGYAVLVKQNRPVKNTVLVISLMFVLSVGLGIAVNGVYPLIVG